MIELAAFQLVWLACAIGAASGHSAPGLVAAGLFLAAQAVARGARREMVATTLASGLAGLAAESLLVVADLVRYSAHWPDARLAPAWIVALWLAFGSTVPTAARLLDLRPRVLAAALGALFGPLTYTAGAQLGALELRQPEWIGLTALAVCWGITLPLLVALARATRGGRATV